MWFVSIIYAINRNYSYIQIYDYAKSSAIERQEHFCLQNSNNAD